MSTTINNPELDDVIRDTRHGVNEMRETVSNANHALQGATFVTTRLKELVGTLQARLLFWDTKIIEDYDEVQPRVMNFLTWATRAAKAIFGFFLVATAGLVVFSLMAFF